MSILSDVGFFALLFFVLVFIHELGHYLMAKWVGIRVEKFSIGMGPSLFAFVKGETEYRLGLLPLGGYVKMSGDDPTKTYDGEEARRGFLTQRPPQKLLVVFGGPVFNLILPIILFGVMLAVGTPSVSPLVGVVQPNFPAAAVGIQPGDKIVSLNGKPIQKWAELEEVVQKSAGVELQLGIERKDFVKKTTETMQVSVTPTLADGKSRFGEDIKLGRMGISPEFLVPLIFFENPQSPMAKAGFQKFDRVRKVNKFPVTTHEEFLKALEVSSSPIEIEIERHGDLYEKTVEVASGKGSAFERLGLVPVFLVVGLVDEKSPAAEAGIQKNDRLVSINGQKLSRWDEVSVLIKGSEGKPLKIVWSRDGKTMEASVTPQQTTIQDPVMGKDNPAARDPAYRIGVGSAAMIDNEFWIEQSWNPIAWVGRGFSKTWEMASMTVEALGKLVTGQLSIKLLGSPIMIYKVAGNSYRMAGGGKYGWISFFSTLALLSITLGLVNLLPIPVLDGGHATFFLIEWIRGKPVSIKVMEVAMQAGMFILFSLFALVLYNDLHRYGWLDSVFNLFR